MLGGKRILIGITGSIAAYKAPFLVRLLIREGAEVKVVMSKSACDFVTPLTLSALSQHPVAIEPFNESDGTWHSHIELGSWADAYVLAPLSANTMAKMATGITDNLLTATFLAARCPVFFAPAMDVDMFNHPTTQANIQKLQSFGNLLIEPQEGELASGLTGYGRMEEPEKIVSILKSYFSAKETLAGKNILITSGPTVEPIDPVRFLSNHSTGLMGNSLALEAAHRGAHVLLVTGPVKSAPVHPSIEVIRVTTAQSMLEACISRFAEADICIMAAAVADYTPEKYADQKIKKGEEAMQLKLKKTVDILKMLGERKKDSQILAGFALETENELENATQKLRAKNLDLIILNSLSTSGAGFSTPTNQITIINKSGDQTAFALKPKQEVASDILDYLSHSAHFNK